VWLLTSKHNEDLHTFALCQVLLAWFI